MSEKIEDLIILGSGPAGLTAAIYAARADLTPLMIHGLQPGGQLTTTTGVENFPGFPDGVQGPELMEAMEKQARRFGTRFLETEATGVDLTAGALKVWAGDEFYRCRALIIATGASARMLGLPREQELYGRGVSVCATCDAAFFRNQEVAVVGGGDTALEEATHLARFARKVTLIHRRDSLRATPPMRKRAANFDNIEFLWNAQVVEIQEDATGVTGLILEDTQSRNRTELPCTGLFVAIGHSPNTALFKDQLPMDDQGYLLTTDQSASEAPGVFVAGDVQDRRFRQAITAAGSGCMAALQAEDFLSDH